MEQERTREVKLGEHTYTVVAQRHAYLQRKLGPRVREALDVSTSGDAEGMVAAATKGYHAILSIFVPDLMPLWEWEGFASETAMESDQYDENADRSPTIDQMVTAFHAVKDVNRIDIAEKLKDLVGPDFFASDLGRALRARAEVAVIGELTKLPETTGEPSSESSPPQNGGPAPTNGGTSVPTPESSSAGPTPASSTS